MQSTVNEEKFAESFIIEDISTKKRGRCIFFFAMRSRSESFVAVLSYGSASALELASMQESRLLDFQIKEIRPRTLTFVSTEETAKKLAWRAGGVFKIAKLCGDSLDELKNCLPIPYEQKFSWTVSGYDTVGATLEETRIAVNEFLKQKSIRKSKYVSPKLEALKKKEEEKKGGNQRRGEEILEVSELKLGELVSEVLKRGQGGEEEPSGFDVVVQGSVDNGRTSYGYTIGHSDVSGYEKRDFQRPYQDPTSTMSPRIARMLVNMALNGGKDKEGGGDDAGALLDPFCGLGTVLQEAIVCGHPAVGIEIQESKVQRARANLEWLSSNFRTGTRARWKVLRGDATRLNELILPKISCVATEPILLSKFERNPSPAEAERLLSKASATYRSALASVRTVVSQGSKLALVSPGIVDARGNHHQLRLDDCEESGFRICRPQVRGGFEIPNPAQVPSSKRKIVTRQVYLMTAA
jgi:tRNA G10  N-methylase Trm11